ncbi:hypothetical protein BASA50_002320 [Batrachochytrium salamandrivorans]|uniref:MIT domain-containing protein n=1 Tax=Batrachochytrium salamandrivorans TaxID=1357716 RepID=A0ABQ8FLN8_9FUNG|nr:hypothetical protein BASA50_002320 [Batrachochytrium salamandrivorans]KAH9245708.1 hypothetical protein BASA81_016786 [Batrachochytrium salamandrivorans]KAH9267263.1 hypothetical protein BASA84_000744 [Batrachochytrium salamandrivorans]KAJ1332863.1 hypothetical protein BSLG_008490 [Batrachochytrium salamandrivorans]
MDGSDAPAQKANAFATAAEDYAARGQLRKAVESHFRAAEQYLLAMNDTADVEAVKTLKLLYASHTRNGKEMQRRISQVATPTSSSPVAELASRPTSTPIPHLYSGKYFPSSHTLGNAPGNSVRLGSDQNSSATIGLHAISSSNSQQRSSAVHLYSNHGQSTTIENAGASSNTADHLSSESALGSRQFFVGQSLSDSTVLPGMPATSRGLSGPTHTPNLSGPTGRSSSCSGKDGLASSPRRTSVSPEAGVFPGAMLGRAIRAGYRDTDALVNYLGSAPVPVKSLDNSNLLSESIGNSYLVLDDNAKEIRKGQEPEDPFNKFWESVERLVDEISLTGPVAFATAPLQGEHRASHQFTRSNMESPSQDLPMDETVILNDESQSERSSSLGNTAILQSYLLVSPNTPFIPHASGGLDHMVTTTQRRTPSLPPYGKIDESFSTPSAKKTLEEYSIENTHLRQIVDKLTTQIAQLGKTEDENTMLKSSIIQLRNDVHRQVKRYLPGIGGASGLQPLSMHNTAGPGSSHSHLLSSAGSGSMLASVSHLETGTMSANIKALNGRIVQLEEELKMTRLELEQQNLIVSKYKDRWEKLKEASKKKKESRMSADLSSSIVAFGDPAFPDIHHESPLMGHAYNTRARAQTSHTSLSFHSSSLTSPVESLATIARAPSITALSTAISDTHPTYTSLIAPSIPGKEKNDSLLSEPSHASNVTPMAVNLESASVSTQLASSTGAPLFSGHASTTLRHSTQGTLQPLTHSISENLNSVDSAQAEHGHMAQSAMTAFSSAFPSVYYSTTSDYDDST